MTEKCYYYDEDGNRCEGEVGPSFEDFPGMARVVSPIPLCDACKKSDFDENDDLTVCKAYGKIPKKYLNAKDYNCPHFDNENNGWYQLIKDKVERQQKKEKYIVEKIENESQIINLNFSTFDISDVLFLYSFLRKEVKEHEKVCWNKSN